MKLEAKDKVLQYFDINEAELLLLYIIKEGYSLQEVFSSLVEKKFILKGEFNEIRLSEKAVNAINKSLYEYAKDVKNCGIDFERLAIQMKALYPSGMKEGTNYYWKCTTPDIVKRLKLLISKYEFSYTEEVINATNRYVQSFNGDYTRMRLLKYFILKTEKDNDGNTIMTSDLMSFIENKNQEDNDRDWTSKVI